MGTNFSQFTNQYSLSKTLRFELKPIGRTQIMLEENSIFQIDKNRKEAYESTKPYLDRLHREFITESLENATLDGLKDYLEIYINYKKDKKNKDIAKKINNQRKALRQEIVKLFNYTGEVWAQEYADFKIKKKGYEILFEEGVFDILKARYGSESETKLLNKETGELFSIFDNWKGFKGYFTKFFETRKNFYKNDGTIATRIIDQNLDRFLENIDTFNAIKEKINVHEVEDYFGFNAEEIFSLNFYNKCLIQEGIDKYNEFIGGKTLDNGEKEKGVNEIINKFRQDNKDQKISFLKKLDKQILSEKEKFIDEIDSDETLVEVLNNFLISAQDKIKPLKTLLDNLFQNSNTYNLEGIFISKEAFNTISHKWTNETELFSTNLYEVLKLNKLVSSSAKKSDGTYSFPDFIALSNIQAALSNILSENKFWKDRYYDESILNNSEDSFWDQFFLILKYEFESLFEKKVANAKTDEITGYYLYRDEIEKLITDFKLNKDTKIVIKNFADSVLHIYQMAKYFALEKKRAWNIEFDDQLDRFYTDPEIGYLKFYDNAYEEIVQVYNKIRNYLTRKPYSEDKWKLNFENPTLAKGWDKNKERDNSSIILRKGRKYYLAVMRKGYNKIFTDNSSSNTEHDTSYEKLNYKLFPDPSKMMPKVCFSKKGLEFFNPSEEVYSIYKNNEFKKGETFSVKSMQKLISFYVETLSTYPGWKSYTFTEVKKSEEYIENIGEFFNDVAKTGYKIWFGNISEEYINAKNEAGELFLFQIYNKDFSASSSGAKNVHTMYFEELFSQSNMDNNFPLKLNGEAELFYRPKSIDKELEKRNFKRDVVKNNRYTENKVFFHVPITLNRIAKNIYRFNTEINDFLANNPDINIIGVDRGEKHLIYYSIVNQNQEIIDRGSFNVINNTNYHEKLEDKAKGREQARKDWQEIEGIKNLKKGYISQVVRKLADLAIEHNAIIVMEDLNMRFKQIRGGIEKSVYQQLEKALIEKLNYLVNKGEKDPEQAGHLLKAYQLAAPFETFKDMGKQTGIIFYTQASYTSKIDPLTGWRPSLYLKYTNAAKAKTDILNFESIQFRNNRFEFTYDLKQFLNSKEYPTMTKWTVCSNVERFRWDRKLNNNKGDYIHYPNLTDNISSLFEEFNISKDSDIQKQIENLDTSVKENAKFFRDLIYYFGLICQIRNTKQDETGNENDFILSPVEPFFDSRKAKEFGNNLPENGDDNGAYNIARKGIVILNKISKSKNDNGSVDDLKWNDLYISHTDWDNFATK